MMVSVGTESRIGSLTSGWEWFKPWRTIGGDTLAEATTLQMNVMLAGVCEQRRFLAHVRDFVIFEADGSVIRKNLDAYHQFHGRRISWPRLEMSHFASLSSAAQNCRPRPRLSGTSPISAFL